jgi:hypothetical protein
MSKALNLNPDPDWNRIFWGQRIRTRIWIQKERKTDQHSTKNKERAWFEELEIIHGSLRRKTNIANLPLITNFFLNCHRNLNPDSADLDDSDSMNIKPNCGGAPSVPTVLSHLDRHVTYYPHICCTYVDTRYSLHSLKYTVVTRLLTCLHLSTSGDPAFDFTRGHSLTTTRY